MARPPRRRTFYETISAAVQDIAAHGYDSQARLDFWLNEITEAAKRDLTPPQVLDQALRSTFSTIYKRLVENGGLIKTHPGVSRFTLQQVAPKLRNELDRRIMASANLIKLNREEAIQKTLRRFSGWATSIPAGGSDAAQKGQAKKDVYKTLSQLPFEERRVLIDQGHKFTSALSEILATNSGAIAAIWHSHWRQSHYNYREDHKERDEQVYTVRSNWALERGLMKVGEAGYTDQITAPGQEVFCRCFYQWVYSLKQLPPEMVTAKGQEAMRQARMAVT